MNIFKVRHKIDAIPQQNFALALENSRKTQLLYLPSQSASLQN